MGSFREHYPAGPGPDLEFLAQCGGRRRLAGAADAAAADGAGHSRLRHVLTRRGPAILSPHLPRHAAGVTPLDACPQNSAKLAARVRRPEVLRIERASHTAVGRGTR